VSDRYPKETGADDGEATSQDVAAADHKSSHKKRPAGETIPPAGIAIL
jgi:hypothetical protein